MSARARATSATDPRAVRGTRAHTENEAGSKLRMTPLVAAECSATHADGDHEEAEIRGVEKPSAGKMR
eukprot:3283094-Pleurochrysis_carterae.AAC.3